MKSGAPVTRRPHSLGAARVQPSGSFDGPHRLEKWRKRSSSPRSFRVAHLLEPLESGVGTYTDVGVEASALARAQADAGRHTPNSSQLLPLSGALAPRDY